MVIIVVDYTGFVYGIGVVSLFAAKKSFIYIIMKNYLFH